MRLHLLEIPVLTMGMKHTSILHFRGQRIWEAIIHDLLPKGLGLARKKSCHLNPSMRVFYDNLVSLQGMEKSLNKKRTSLYKDPKLFYNLLFNSFNQVIDNILLHLKYFSLIERLLLDWKHNHGSNGSAS
ncbi:pectin acetylesterase 9-like [Mercurialis annua]|uniref:pectin acetylesterase 9-like n=1 Tax=Mercurialis annua TaxID=3986 RepID=UPI0024AFE924|nr:pectin acetylesterase 9-like [Mercurialis annua]